MPRKATIVLAISCITLFLSCSCPHGELPEGMSTEFFWMPKERRNAQFEKYDFETQYQIYIYGSECIEPPVIGLACPLARQGGRIVRPLEAKLDSAKDDPTIDAIIFVFRVMNNLGTYDVASDKPLMEKLREKVSAMKNPAMQIMTQDQVLAITPDARRWPSC